ncbi:ATP-dependent DNA helicase Q5 isoform X2 [Phyllobates terribilis]
MNLRKSKELEEFIQPSEDCPLKDGANDKIPKLTVKAREHCLKMLREAISKNVQDSNTADRVDVSSFAMDLEYEVFRSSKMSNLYKAAVLKKVAEINKASKEGEPYVPLGSCNSSEKIETKVDAHEDGFVSAAQLQKFKRKRVGAPSLFQTASSLLQTTTTEIEALNKQPIPGSTKLSEPNSASTPSEKTESPSKKVNSPNKKTHQSKKKQDLASAAAKDSQDISKFFSFQKKSKSTTTDNSLAKIDSPGPAITSFSDNCEIHETFSSDPLDRVIKRKNGTDEDEQDPSRESEIVPPSEKSHLFVDNSTEQSSNTKKLMETEAHTTMTTDMEAEDMQPSETCPMDAFILPPLQTKEPSEESQVPSLSSPELVSDFAAKRSSISRSPESEKNESEQQKSVESARKRLKTEEKSSSILSNAEKGYGGGQGKKKVTFDPNLHQKDKEGTAKILQPPGNKVVTLKETADIVVKYLTPFFRDGKFASKDLFKAFARQLSHHLAGDNKAPLRRTVKEEAQRLIKTFFKNRASCQSDADWQELLHAAT